MSVSVRVVVLLLALIVAFERLPAQSGIQRVWAVDDGERIKKTATNHPLATSPDNKVWNGSSISLFGARNEIVAFQIIIQATSSGASGVNVRLDSLRKSTSPVYTIKNTGGIGDPYNYVGKRIEMFVQHYMNITDRTNSNYIWWGSARPGPDAEYTGLQPEILVPFEAPAGMKAHGQGGAPFTVTPSQNQGVWVDVYIPRDAPPGDYTGTLRVTENGTSRYSIPVSLQVYGFTLPDSSRLRSAFLLTPDAISSRHGLPQGSSQYWQMVRRYYAFLYRHRANAQHTADTAAFRSNLGQIYTGAHFTPANGYEGPGQGIGPNYYQIGGFDQPSHVPGTTGTPEPWYEIPGGDFYRMRSRGTWAPGVSYAVNDVVRDDDYPYLYWCKMAHTSSLTSEPQESGTGSTGWRKYWVRYYDRGNSCSFDFDADSSVMRRNWWRAADWWVDWFRANNPTAWIMKYGAEEPNIEGGVLDTSAYADIRRKTRWLRTNPSGKILEFRLASTFQSKQWPVNREVDVLYVGPGQSPIYGGFLQDSAVGYRARGVRIGLYGGTRPHFGTEAIDAPAIEQRMIPWAMWKYGIAEYSYWRTGVGGWNPWDRDRNAYRTIVKYGDGTLLYEGQDRLYPSDSRNLAGPVGGIRLKNWRRGAQDYEYIRIAQDRGIDVSSVVNSVVPAAFDDVSPTLQAPWQTRGHRYENARRQLAELIEEEFSPLPHGTFTVNPTMLTSGPGNVTLTWTSINAVSASIDRGIGPVGLSGSRVVFVDSTTTFTLTMTNGTGSRAYAVTVVVRLLPSGFLNAVPDTLSSPGTTTLSWTSTNAQTARIDPGVGSVPVNGSRQVTVNELTKYVLTLGNSDGSTLVSRSVFIRTPPTGTLRVTPDSIPYEGGEVTIAWTSRNALVAALNLGIGTVNPTDSVAVFLSGETEVALALTNPFGQVVYQVRVYRLPYRPEFVSVPPESLAALSPATGNYLKPVRDSKYKRGGGFPNWSDLLAELVEQGGFEPGSSESDEAGGMVVGVAFMRPGYNGFMPNSDSASHLSWARLSGWKFRQNIGRSFRAIQSSLRGRREGPHTGSPRGFDSTGTPGEAGRKPLVRQQTKLAPVRHNNRLFAELVALKVNIAASQIQKTPAGFGELIYDVDGSTCDELTIRQLAERADSFMTYWRGRTSTEVNHLYDAIYAVNRAFVAPMDTVSFYASGQLVLRGTVELSSVPFLRSGSEPPIVRPPTTTVVQGSDGDDDERFFDDEESPNVAELLNNYPNPFNPTTTISVGLREPALVTIQVYNLLGQEVRTLAAGEDLGEGIHEFTFDAAGLASGVYFTRVRVLEPETGYLTEMHTRKMILMK